MRVSLRCGFPHLLEISSSIAVVLLFLGAATSLRAQPNYPIPRSTWTITHVDSQEMKGGYWGPATPATSAIDGNSTTFWHTEWYSVQPGFPHEIRIDLGAPFNVTGFHHLPRQDGNLAGRIAQYEFYVSTDGLTWGTPVVAGTLPNTAAASTVPSPAVVGRFIRFRALASYDPYNFAASLAELNVLTDNQAPNGVIITPSANVTVSAGGSVSFSATGTDSENHLPLSYAWSFGTGSGVPDSTAQNPGSVQFTIPGTYLVRLTVSDARGQIDPTPATVTVTVNDTTSGPPLTPIPQAPWTIKYVDSQEMKAGYWGPATPATSAIDGNPTTFWHTEWYSVQPNFPHEIQVDLAASHRIRGFRHLPRQDGNLAGRINQYEIYVSGDGITWGSAVAAGSLANTASETTIPCAATTARFVRLRALSSYGPATVAASLAEFNVLTDNQAPNGVINTPATSVTITAGGALSFAANGTDADANTPLAYNWSFGTGSVVADSTLQNPANITFNNPGVFIVRLTVADSLGQTDPTPATVTVNVEPSNPGASFTSIPRAAWTIKYVDSQEMTGGSWGPATPAMSAIDGNPGTFWHTEWYSVQPDFPHELQIDLGTLHSIRGFKHLPRQDGNLAGRIAQYEFYVSTDGTTWGAAVAAGTFPNSASESAISTTAKTGRYIRLRALSSYDSYGFAASLAETNVLTDNQAPESVINSPADSVTIAPGSNVVFEGSGVDPDGNTPLSFSWSFGANSGIPNSTTQNPGPVQFNTPGTYTVRFIATDSLGQADPTPAVRTITVVNQGPSVIPRTGWSVMSVDSQESTSVSFAGNGIGARAIDGNIYTMWHTAFRNSQPPPPHEIRVNLGSVRAIAGFRYLPSQDGNQNTRIAEFEFYVSTDGASWGSPVATGHFANTQAESEILFPPVNGQYVRLRALNNQHSSLFTAVAELNVLQANTSPNSAPNGLITSPASSLTIPAGAAVNFSGAGTDPEAQPLTYRWTFSAGSGIADISARDPGPIRFTHPGTHVAKLVVADSNGGIDPTPATVNITVDGWQSLSTAGWSLHATNSQELTAGYWGPATPATNAFDGNSGTFWHSQWYAAVPPLPHEIQINLGSAVDVAGFTYLPRQDGNTAGRVALAETYLSLDGSNWGSPVIAPVFDNTMALKQVVFPKQTARYLRFRSLGEVLGNQATSAAELRLLSPTTIAPSVRLVTPLSQHIQPSSTLVLRAEANLLAGQGVRFTVDGSTVADDYTAPFETNANGLAQTEHVVEAFVISPSGDIVSGVAARDRSEDVAIGDYIVAMGDSITHGIGDDIAADNASLDGRNASAGFTPVLADYLSVALGKLVYVANEGVGGENSAQAAVRIASVLKKHPHAQRVLLMYGTNDAFVSRPSGIGLNPGDAAYAGTYKQHIQSLLDAIKAAGKTAVIAKIPVTLPINGTNDQRIQQYNLVINELLSNPANSAITLGPDFYTYFSSRTNTHFVPDNVHPNGVGYQGMADLWFDVLSTP